MEKLSGKHTPGFRTILDKYLKTLWERLIHIFFTWHTMINLVALGKNTIPLEMTTMYLNQLVIG